MTSGSSLAAPDGKIEAGKEAAIEAEVRAARERAVVPLEIRMKQFRDMLAEKEVSDCDYKELLPQKPCTPPG